MHGHFKVSVMSFGYVSNTNTCMTFVDISDTLKPYQILKPKNLRLRVISAFKKLYRSRVRDVSAFKKVIRLML